MVWKVGDKWTPEHRKKIMEGLGPGRTKIEREKYYTFDFDLRDEYDS